MQISKINYVPNYQIYHKATLNSFGNKTVDKQFVNSSLDIDVQKDKEEETNFVVNLVKKGYDMWDSFSSRVSTYFDSCFSKKSNDKKSDKPINSTVTSKNLLKPNFTMDYDKILQKLLAPEDVDATWVKNNIAVLNGFSFYEDNNENSEELENDIATLHQIQANHINRNRQSVLASIYDLKTKEYAEFINSIRDEYININPDSNEQKALIGLRNLQKYGTRDDLLSLNDYYYQISQNDKIMREYAKLVGKVGNISDSRPLRALLKYEKINQYSEKTFEEVMLALKELFVNKPDDYSLENYSYAAYKKFDDTCLEFPNNKIMREAAETIKEVIKRENPTYD